jgi:MFS family permease
MPPQRNDVSLPSWTLIGPGLATIVGLFLLTAVFFGTERTTPIQLDLGLSGPAFLLQAFLAYLVAAAIAFPLGLLLGGRSQTAVILPAVGLMLIGVVLIALANAAGMLTVGRVLSGLGAGAATGVTTALLRRINGPRGIAAAVMAALGVLAMVIAPFVNQQVAGALTFRMGFLMAVPVLVVVLLLNAVLGIVLFTRNRRPVEPAQAYVPNTTRR